ncbi:hypothetical protein RFI_09202, partial [Reticulomyxa filosa]
VKEKKKKIFFKKKKKKERVCLIFICIFNNQIPTNNSFSFSEKIEETQHDKIDESSPNTLGTPAKITHPSKDIKSEFEKKIVEFYRKDNSMHFQEILHVACFCFDFLLFICNQLTGEEQDISYSVLRQEIEIRQSKSPYFAYFDVTKCKPNTRTEKISQKLRILQRVVTLRGLSSEESKRILQLCTDNEIEA